MKVMDLGEGEASFGLIIRDKNNHDNYILLSFENIKEISDEFQDLQKRLKIIQGDNK
ncbi:MAG: hypothetical protein OPY07_06850 [Nitrosopumilus sp.]|nr:hypothetical protein [Nitrosopumilus sp.]